MANPIPIPPLPPPPTESDISALVDMYVQNAGPMFGKLIQGLVRGPEENLQYNNFGQFPYTIVASIELSSLSVPILRRLPIYLLREFQVQVELDSKWYWALTADVVRRTRFGRAWTLYRDFEVLMSAHFAVEGVPSITETEWFVRQRISRAMWELLPKGAHNLLTGYTTVAMYISYPILEGVCKSLLAQYVDADGNVLRKIKLPGISRSPGFTISSLGELLKIIELGAGSMLGRPDLSLAMIDMRREVETLAKAGQPPLNGWDWVYGLRKELLHGTTPAPLHSSLLTLLICGLLWHAIDEVDADTVLKSINTGLRHRKAQRSMGFRMMDMDWYPPV
jgi:hypothetical protein